MSTPGGSNRRSSPPLSAWRAPPHYGYILARNYDAITVRNYDGGLRHTTNPDLSRLASPFAASPIMTPSGSTVRSS